MKRLILALTLAAVSALRAADTDAQLSVSVTPGGSIRVVQIGKNGSPSLLDKGAGEGQWNRSPDPQLTFIPENATILGLANAEVRAFAVAQDGLVEWRASRSNEAWTRTVIDARAAEGHPCAVHSGSSNYVFVRSAAGGLIATREQPSGWTSLTLVESALQSPSISSLSCGSLGSGRTAIVVGTLGGGRAATLNSAGEPVAVSDLRDATGSVVAFASDPVVTSSTASSDIVGISLSGTLAHWSQLSGSSSWQYETINLPIRLSTSPSAAWFQNRLFLSGQSGDGKIVVLNRAADGSWENSTVNPPAKEAYASDPHVISQPDRLSILTTLTSGKVAELTYKGTAWVSSGVVGQQISPEAAARSSAVGSTGAVTQTLNQFVDSIPALVPPPQQPPTVTGTTKTYQTVQGIRFEDLTMTNIHSANLAEVITSNPSSDLIWPGSMIQGQSIATGSLAGVGLSRAPMTITISGAAGTGPLSVTVPSPSLSTVATGIQNLLQNLNLVKATAAVDFDSQTGNTEEDALLNLGVSANFLGQSVKASVTLASTQKSNTVAVKFVQRYYTLAVDTPPSPASMFASSVSADDARRFMGTSNPPAYMSQVTYGRMIVYVFESSESIDKLKSTVDVVFKVAKVGGEVKLDAEQQRVFNNAHIHWFALGGSAEDVMNLVAGGDFTKQFSAYLTQGANFSFTSSGAPLSYTLKFLKDGTVAQINSATQWQSNARYALPERSTFYIGLGSRHRDCATAYTSGTVQTGFYVRPGDRFSVQASGQIWSGVFATGFNPPNGWYTWNTPKKGVGFPNEEVSPFSLLYRIGATKPLFSGYGFPSRQFNDSTGELGLLINSNDYNSGSGCFAVTVNVERQN